MLFEKTAVSLYLQKQIEKKLELSMRYEENGKQ